MTATFNMRRVRFDGNSNDVAEDIRSKYAYDGDLLGIYAANKGPMVHKWHHYIPIYAKYFERFRNTPVRFLEIGVSKGGSIQMWRNYFGSDAVLFGIDINPDCAALNGTSGQIRIGSQEDTAFLDQVIDEMGGIDIVLDDGSHEMAHVRATFEHLFPRLELGGLYMIEDLHTAYWPDYGGSYDGPANFFSFVRELTDDMHHWYHDAGQRHEGLSSYISGIHLHDSIAVFDKQATHRPVHSRVR